MKSAEDSSAKAEAARKTTLTVARDGAVLAVLSAQGVRLKSQRQERRRYWHDGAL